jgi:hypothetical protein
VDCTKQQFYQISSTKTCTATNTYNTRYANFTCKAYNRSGDTYGIGYSCREPSTNVWTLEQISGNCDSTNAQSYIMLLEENKCTSGVVWDTRITSSQYLEVTALKYTVKTYYNSYNCSGTPSSLTFTPTQACYAQGGNAYRLVKVGVAANGLMVQVHYALLVAIGSMIGVWLY